MDCPLVFVNLSEAAANLKRRPIEVIKIELRKRNKCRGFQQKS